MFKMAVGYSEDVDEGDAIAEALDAAAGKLEGETPTAGVLFAGTDYDHEPLVAEVLRRYPDINLIGCAANAQMSTDSGFADVGITLTLFASDVIDITSGVGENVSADPVGASKRAVLQALAGTDKEPALAIAFTDLLQTDLDAVVRAVAEDLGEGVPLIGGASAPEDFRITPWQTSQFFGDRVLSDSVPILLLSGPLKYSTAIAHGWSPTGKQAKVTNSERNQVEAIGDETVMDYYRNYLGDDIGSLFAHPLAVYDADDNFVLRAVTGSDDESGTASFMGEVPQGSTVQVSMTTVPDILGAAKQTLSDAIAHYPGPDKPQGAFLVSCAVRQMLLGSQATQEAAGIQETMGADFPMAGFYASAEIGPTADGTTRLHNATFVTLLLGT